jgi:uncharacterized NAD(P)/FAD-binding protein YdhS
MRVVVFEPRGQIGPGLAYQQDVGTALLNRNAETMSVSAQDYSTFSAWLRWKGHHEEELKSVSGADLTAAYVPRATFGRFLSDFFLESCAAALKKGLEIEIVPHSVEAIRRGERYQIRYADQTLLADSVLLAVGNTGSRDHYRLAGHPRFVAAPYPLSREVLPLAKANRICIIGSGLTAVDIAVTLAAHGYEGTIDMVSNSGHLPFVRGRQGAPHRLRYLTRAALLSLSGNGSRKSSLRAVFRLLRAELRAVGCCWRALLCEGAAPVERLRSELAAAGQSRPWQRVLAATNDVIELAWHVLTGSDQQLVMKRYARAWMARRAPMPASNASVLLGMIETGRLRLRAGAPSFDRSEPDSLRATFAPGDACSYDHVINATGAAKWVEQAQDAPLIWQLLQDGYAVTDPLGGIRVDFATGAVIDEDNEPDWNMRALGHLTSGTYFFVSSLEMIARRAQHIASDVLSSLAPHHKALAAGPAAAPVLE